MKNLMIFPLSIALATVLSSCVSGGGNDKEALYEQTSIVKVGDKIPEFTVEDSGGGKFFSSDLTGKRSLIFFFYTECGDCQVVFPVAQQLWEMIENDDRYEMVPVSRGESAENVGDYFAGEGITMPYYIDLELETYSKFAKQYVPRLYIVGADGTVEWMAVEHLPADVQTAADLMSLLAG